MKSQSILIKEFVGGKEHGEASHMYIEGDTLYSYGSHFPLLVKTAFGFLLNADKYSSTTSSHQSSCMKHATIQVPFSALRRAGINYRGMELVAHEAQRWDTVGYQRQVSKDGGLAKMETISVAEYGKLSEREQEGWYPKEERRPESTIIKHDGKFYLSSMDGNNFFLSQLPEPATSIVDAFASLMPKQVIGKEYIRQGEWFFIVAEEAPFFVMVGKKPVSPERYNKITYREMKPKFTLPKKNADGNNHIATRGIQFGEGIWVSGQVRHVTNWGTRGEHRMLHLSTADHPIIFQAFENRALASWSAGGRVD